MNYSKLRKLLTDTRYEKKLPQHVVGEKVNVAWQTIHSWEAEKTQPKAEQLLDWCNALGFNVEIKKPE